MSKPPLRRGKRRPGRCRTARLLEEIYRVTASPGRIGPQPLSHTVAASDSRARLQPLSHTVAASAAYGCSLYRIRLQATVSLKDLSLPGVPGVLLPGEPPDQPPDEAAPQPFLTASRRPGGPREE